MATFTFTLQGVSPTTIDAADALQFASGSFNGAITVGSYNDSMHVNQNQAGAVDDSSGNTPENNKFISQSGGTGGDSQADWGDGTEDLDAILTTECALKVNFSDAASVSTSSAIFYAYDASTQTNGPTGVTCLAAEQGDTHWRTIHGSASPGTGTGTGSLSLSDQGASTSHDFFIAITASPDSVGSKTAFKIRCELTYT